MMLPTQTPHTMRRRRQGIYHPLSQRLILTRNFALFFQLAPTRAAASHTIPPHVRILRSSSITTNSRRVYDHDPDEEEEPPFVSRLIGLVIIVCLGWAIVQGFMLPGCSEGVC